MQETVTVRVGQQIEVGDKTYMAETYIVKADEAARMVDAGARIVGETGKASPAPKTPLKTANTTNSNGIAADGAK